MWWSTIIVDVGSVIPPNIGRVWEGSTSLGDWVLQDSCVYQCNNKVGHIGVPSGVGH